MSVIGRVALEGVTWFWVLQSALALLKTHRARRLFLNQRQKENRHDNETDLPRAVVIVPAKGVSGHFGDFVEFILGQDYPDYHVIFITESEQDAAHAFLRERLFRPAKCGARLIVAGPAKHSVQKVHNQLAAFRLLDESDRIIAFADSDLSAGTDWLSRLVKPLRAGLCDFTTGYRWFMPADQSMPNRIVTLIGTAVEPWIGPNWRMCLWAGSMVMTREVFDELDIPGNFRGSFNDDVRVSRLALQAGKRMRYVRSVAVASPIDFTWRTFFAFGRRQYMHLAEHRPLWWMALMIPALYLAGFGLCLFRLASGDWWMLAPLGVAAVLNIVRTRVRLAYLKDRFPNGAAPGLKRAVRGSWWMDPVVNLVHLAVIVASACGRQVVWAGIRYRVRNHRDAEVISGTDT